MTINDLNASRPNSHHGGAQYAVYRARFGATIGLFAIALFTIALILARAGAVHAAQQNPADIVALQSAQLERPLTAGQSSVAVVTARIADGWHINSNRPIGNYAIPTRIEVTPPADTTVGAIAYPEAHLVTLAFAGTEKLAVYSGTVQFRIPFSASAAFRNSVGAPAKIELHYQACNDSQCLRPVSIGTTIDLSAGSTASTTTDSNGIGATASGLTENGLASSDSAIAEVFLKHGYIVGLLVVLLGGLALNLTPCVYPLIGVTIAYFGNESGAPRKVIVLASLYVLGIALMFSGVGVAVALSGGLFGAALQNPYVLAVIAAMLLTLAASSFGLFSLQPPQWIMQRAGVARPGYFGALLMGLGMGVVAAPCIGPIVLGLLLMVQRSQSALFGFVLFFTLAVGLGLPYIALAMAAGSIRKLPRSGEWLAWIEQLFGFVLVGLALYFLDPLTPNRLITRALPYYAVAVGLLLGFISRAGQNLRLFVVIRYAIGTVSALALVYLLTHNGPAVTQLAFEPFNPALLQTAKSEGRPVVIDFSADWCVPCREMERTTFVDPAVVRAADKFVRLRANLTADNTANQAIIKQFTVEGVPTTVFIDEHGIVRKRRVGYVGPGEFLGYLHQFD
ncbi:MAG TPA: cytochrome c biogenesis protein CcdA [Candidatus Binataceae bacterium]